MHFSRKQADACRYAFAHGEGDSACPPPGEAGVHQQHSLMVHAGGLATSCTEKERGMERGIQMS